VIGIIRVLLPYSSISAPMGEYGVDLSIYLHPNMRINLINYFYFFLDLHV